MKKTRFKILALAATTFFVACNNTNKNNEPVADTPAPINIIFDTDMGNDVDDVLAIDMLYKYADQDKINLLGVLSNKFNPYSVPFIHLLNHWYGYPDLPVGTVENGADSEGDSRNYAEGVLMMQKDGKPLFTLPDTAGKYNEATRLYRKLLAGQKDSSVVVVSVGFSTNLERLLVSPPDDLSALNGAELVAKKVKLLSVMAGNFDGRLLPEYNVVKDINAAKKVFAEWPGVVVFTPFELGIRVNYPAVSIENDFSWANPHPLTEAYKYYLDMPYDRPSWDLLSVLYAVEGAELFQKSAAGKVVVNDKGITTFEADETGSHYYLNASDAQTDSILSVIKNLVTQKPKALK